MVSTFSRVEVRMAGLLLEEFKHLVTSNCMKPQLPLVKLILKGIIIRNVKLSFLKIL